MIDGAINCKLGHENNNNSHRKLVELCLVLQISDLFDRFKEL